MLFRILIISLMATVPCSAVSVIYTSDNYGMFFSFINVVAGLVSYESGTIKGFRVDTETTPPYYDESHGPNWWSYYCEPVELGILDPRSTVKRPLMIGGGCIPPGYVMNQMSRVEVNRVINDYIIFKSFIWEEVNQFCEDHFKENFIIGIHYRGTDKPAEAPRVSYQKVSEAVVKQIATIGDRPIKIFIATDEEAFLAYMRLIFPGYVCCLQNVYRSSSDLPIHYYNVDAYESGKGAVLDAILLSKTDVLIKTASNLSLWSTYMNPEMPVVEISQNYNQM